MHSNNKLTGVIKGRTIIGTQNAADGMTLTFDDGSTLHVKTAGDRPVAVTGGTVQAVRQEGTTLELVFESGANLEIPLAEPTSCVMVRDKRHVLEYAD
ncbi:MAG TPA: hypothetical protein VKU00_11660 [Chthonomonadaceae bacterium]|nr:hypothetical protein [Chthonomonadaceae bacterium]